MKFLELVKYELPSVTEHISIGWIQKIIGRYIGRKVNRKLKRYKKRMFREKMLKKLFNQHPMK